MKMIFTASLAAIALTTATACTDKSAGNAAAGNDAAATSTAEAASIDGTWKADLKSARFEEDASVYLLKDGNYSCSTCIPPISIPADGAFHPVADAPYYDSASVQVVDDKTVKSVRRKGDRVVSESTTIVSADGNTLTFTFNDMTTPNAPPVTGKGTEKRVGPAPAGAHAISGSWKTGEYENISDEGLTVTFRVEGDTLNMSSPAGQSYAAKMDGTDAPIQGDTGGTMVSVRRPAPNVIEETFKRDGKAVSVVTSTLNPDGTLTSVSEDKRRKSKTTYTSRRQ